MEQFCSEEVKELAGAMLKVQEEITPAVKDGENPFAKIKYATLNSVVETLRDLMKCSGVIKRRPGQPVLKRRRSSPCFLR